MKLFSPAAALAIFCLAALARGDLVGRLLSGMSDEEECEANLVVCRAALDMCPDDDMTEEEGMGNDEESMPTFCRPPPAMENVCEGTDPKFESVPCMVDGVVNALEQAGRDVTEGCQGEFETEAEPITTTFFEAGLCPVNVHWHRGTEHVSVGQCDENGKGPNCMLGVGRGNGSCPNAPPRLGFVYNSSDGH